jgi:WD40 repeat protein
MHPDDAHVVSGGYDRVVHIYSLKSGEEIKTCTGHSAPVTQVAFNPYGNLAISSSRDGTIRFWDCLSGVCVRILEEPLGEITSVNINGAGSNLLVCARFGAPRILDARTGNTVTRFASHGPLSTGSMYRPTFAAGDTVVFSGSDDGVVVAWDAATGQPIRRLTGHTAPVTRTVWFAPMSLLASVSLDSTLRVWHWDPAQKSDRGDRSPDFAASL